MDKPTIKKTLAKQIKVIATVEQCMSLDRWKRAKALSEIHSMINWAKSPYESFRKFVAQEIPNIDAGTALTWAINYNQMTKWYTWKDIQLMAKSLAYTKAVRFQQLNVHKPKMPLSKFIKAAVAYKFVRTPKTLIPNENRVVLNMPVLYVEKLESMLAPYGYRIPKSKQDPKIGISDAMVKYLDTV